MIKVAQKSCSESTTAKVSTDGPDDDSQQGPEHTEARPRADRSSVAGCNDAELEQTAAQSPGKMLQISSRQQTSLREREREREKLHQTEAKPADSEVQSQVSKDGLHSAERLCTATSKEETSFSRRYIPQRKIQKRGELQPACNAREKRQG